jgi:uncharacterized protein (DUF2336 family)
MRAELDQHAPARSISRGLAEPVRVRVGANSETPPEILCLLANDPLVTVRAAVAMNEAAPPQAVHLLAKDDDERVRALIARKLGALAPGLSDHEQERLRQQTYEALAALAADEAVRVRAALADVLKEMPDAPRELILALAHDTELPVAEPVIRFSPLLTEQDLLALLTEAPHHATIISVARRPHLNEAVCDRIAATANVSAIRVLLSNQSAAIREATLDALITSGAEHIEWHEPLVRRPKLPAGSARKLAEIVADHLLEVLANRADLDGGLLGELRSRLKKRLEARACPAPAGCGAGTVSWTDGAAPGTGKRVTETMLLQAARQGDAKLAAALLASAAGVPLAVVQRAGALRSTKGLVSLIWKAGFTMAVAAPVQALLARLAPAALLGPDPGGNFPLAADEMRWHLDFLGRMGR